MTSLIPSAVRSNRKLTIAFAALTVFVGLPVILFIAMAVQGFVVGAGNESPVDVVATGITKSSAMVTWHTDKKAQGVVEYGTTPASLNSYAPEIENKREHAVNLTLLTPATTYYYQLKINGTVYDNDGVPWTFTTKTKDGEDVAEAIKGIATRIAREDEEATEEAEISTGNCTATTCEEIKNNLGKGCSSADYFKCISAETEDGTSGVTGYQSYTTPIPTPTVVLIVSNLCKLDYLQEGNDCTEWTWDSFDTKPQICRSAFDRYVVQCRNTSFTEGSDNNKVIWYYNNALTHLSSNSATLKVKPNSGDTVYCQVRVEDEMGGESHSTPWVRASKKCE